MRPGHKTPFRWLRYSGTNSGPMGYRVRMALIAFVPIAPMLALNISPQTNWLTLAWFIAALAWGTGVYAYAIRQLWASIWKRPE